MRNLAWVTLFATLASCGGPGRVSQRGAGGGSADRASGGSPGGAGQAAGGSSGAGGVLGGAGGASVCAASTPGGGAPPYPVDPAPLAFPIIDGLYQRPEATPIAVVGPNDGIANSYSDPFPGSLGGRYLLFFRDSRVTVSGQGYLLVRWELAYFNRGGLLSADVMPTYQVTSGSLKKVALAWRDMMTDSPFNGTPGSSGIWRPGYQTGTTEFVPITLPPGTPPIWGNEYYYLDGTVTITNHEGGADYNLGITPVTWQQMHDDVTTAVRATSIATRPGISLDPYDGAVRPGSPVGLVAKVSSSSRVDLSWSDCSSDEDGFIVEYSYDGTFGGKSYPGGTLFAVGETLPAEATALPIGFLQPATHYYFRVRAFNSAGDSELSNVAEATTLAATALPEPWKQADIAAAATPVGVAGSASAEGGNITVRVASNDLWDTSDSFHFVYQPLTGDGTITARVVDTTYTNQWTKAGVMIRETLDPDSPYAMTMITGFGGVLRQWRSSKGGVTASSSVGLRAAPYWLRVVRRGNIFTSFSSPDGIAWVAMDPRTIAMAPTVTVGLALASVNNAMENVTTFDSASLGP